MADSFLNKSYDVVIIGAGPAGSTCAFQLRKSGLKIAVLDKDIFPRDKICGDMLSADVINQLALLDPAIVERFDKMEEKLPAQGLVFVAPSHELLEIPFTETSSSIAPGCVSKRINFDNFLFNHINSLENVDIYQGIKITGIEREENCIHIKTEEGSFRGQMLVGADGANSIVNRKLGNSKIKRKHHMAGLRQYYKNVKNPYPDNHVELHFYDEILPGYFWIFPLPNGEVNVGLGMRSDKISKNNINLKELLDDLIANHPNLKDRFVDAEPLEKMKGFGLPAGSQKRNISGERFLLLGDAAGLIDPFTGEGIGNAIRSGRIAADHIVEAFAQREFGISFQKAYDKEIYRRMWKELRISASLQGLLRFPRLFSYVVRKSNSNPSIRQLMISMLDNIDIQAELTKPSFYWKLFFSKFSIGKSM